MSSLVRNANKIVSISRNINGASSWRKSLSTIMGNYRDNSYTKITQHDDLDVSEDIELLMEKGTPEISFINEKGYPVETFISNNESKFSKMATAVGAFSSILNKVSGGSSDTKTSGTFAPWVTNVPAWKSTNAVGVKFDYEFNFALGQYGFWNAKEEVVKPILNLAAPTIAQHLNAFTMSGPFPDEINLLTNLLSNAFSTDDNGRLSVVNEATEAMNSVGSRWSDVSNVSSAASALGNTLEDIGGFLEKLILYSYQSYTYTVAFGKILTLNSMLITDSKISFSSETDEEGWPIRGACKLTFQGVIPPALTSSGSHNMAMRFGL